MAYKNEPKFASSNEPKFWLSVVDAFWPVALVLFVFSGAAVTPITRYYLNSATSGIFSEYAHWFRGGDFVVDLRCEGRRGGNRVMVSARNVDDAVQFALETWPTCIKIDAHRYCGTGRGREWNCSEREIKQFQPS